MKKNWSNLVRKCCPCCGYKLERHEMHHTTFRNVSAASWECPNTMDCPGFRIGEQRMKEIVENMEQSDRRGSWAANLPPSDIENNFARFGDQ